MSSFKVEDFTFHNGNTIVDSNTLTVTQRTQFIQALDYLSNSPTADILLQRLVDLKVPIYFTSGENQVWMDAMNSGLKAEKLGVLQWNPNFFESVDNYEVSPSGIPTPLGIRPPAVMLTHEAVHAIFYAINPELAKQLQRPDFNGYQGTVTLPDGTQEYVNWPARSALTRSGCHVCGTIRLRW